ncbi:MAG: diaminopimelate epimerase [Chlorobi bacterium]|nr:diaminopimelate epimerase [Chlorobiota bacterium]MCI0716507.1 diaminopimelate epimerase [Chlorobiota bacterium]
MKYEIYSGAGNDFVMIDNRNKEIPFEKQEQFTIDICSQRFKDIDGVIFLDLPLKGGSAVRMNYYNRDGSFGAMCGNGARCIAMFAFNNDIVNDKLFIIEAVDDTYKAEIIDELNVRISFPEPKEIRLDLNIEADFGEGLKKLILSYANVASDHLVVFLNGKENKSALITNSLDKLDLNKYGKILRFQKEFQPRGANVNFVSAISGNEIRIRTYERGVERETLACGTGIVTSAVILALKQIVKPPVRVLVESGEWLKVDFKIKDLMIKDLSLEGSAKKISEGKLN